MERLWQVPVVPNVVPNDAIGHRHPHGEKDHGHILEHAGTSTTRGRQSLHGGGNAGWARPPITTIREVQDAAVYLVHVPSSLIKGHGYPPHVPPPAVDDRCQEVVLFPAVVRAIVRATRIVVGTVLLGPAPPPLPPLPCVVLDTTVVRGGGRGGRGGWRVTHQPQQFDAVLN